MGVELHRVLDLDRSFFARRLQDRKSWVTLNLLPNLDNLRWCLVFGQTITDVSTCGTLVQSSPLSALLLLCFTSVHQQGCLDETWTFPAVSEGRSMANVELEAAFPQLRSQ